MTGDQCRNIIDSVLKYRSEIMPAYRYIYRNQYSFEGELTFNARNDKLALNKVEEINVALWNRDVVVCRPYRLERGRIKMLIKGVFGFTSPTIVKSWGS